jgi:DNA phosphorothioation-dependent restriction protein DptG
MSDTSDRNKKNRLRPPRVLADFGGRRKIFDRRLKQEDIDDFDRRSGQDRRSGFDRRSAVLDDPTNNPKNRKGS